MSNGPPLSQAPLVQRLRVLPTPAGLALKFLVSSGEPLSQDLLAQLRGGLPRETSVLNLYGSTEVAADVTCYIAPDAAGGGLSEAPSPGASRPWCAFSVMCCA